VLAPIGTDIRYIGSDNSPLSPPDSGRNIRGQSAHRQTVYNT